MRGPSKLVGRMRGNRVTQGRETASGRATPEEAAALSTQCAPTDGHGAGSAGSPRRGRRRQGRAEAPPPAGARRAQANKAPLRISRPPLPPPAGPAPSLAHPLPPSPTKRALCPPPCARLSGPREPRRRRQGSASGAPDRIPTPPHARVADAVLPPPIQSPQSRKQRF